MFDSPECSLQLPETTDHQEEEEVVTEEVEMEMSDETTGSGQFLYYLVFWYKIHTFFNSFVKCFFLCFNKFLFLI